MRRSHDWPSGLALFLLNNRKTPFEWGKNDCCLFAADAIVAMGGKDVAKEVRGKYKTALGAKRVMNKLGAKSLVELLTQRLGKPDGKLTRGSIVVIESDGQQVAGVYYNKPWALTEDGLQGMAVDSVIQSWSLS